MNIKFKNSVYTGSYCYTIMTDDGQEHVRNNMPCYGELRKYESTHKGECTQPSNYKPGDLHFPFPKEGKPIAVRVGFNNATPTALEYWFGKDSPWLGHIVDDIQIEGKQVQINNMAIDSTVMVNAFKTCTTNCKNIDQIEALIKEGLSVREALAATLLNSMHLLKQGIYQADNYSTAANMSLKRILSGKPKDVTGGNFCDRVDYNRTNLADVWSYHVGAVTTNWWGPAMKAAGAVPYSGRIIQDADWNKMAEMIKKVFADRLKVEEEPTNELFIWKTTSGKTNAPA